LTRRLTGAPWAPFTLAPGGPGGPWNKP